MLTASWERLIELARNRSGKDAINKKFIPRNNTFAQQGAPAKGLFLIRSGLVELNWQAYPNDNLEMASENIGQWAGWSGPGSVLGLEAFSSEKDRHYDFGLTALTDCEVYCLPVDQIKSGPESSESESSIFAEVLRAGLEEQTRRHARLAAVMCETRELTHQAVIARIILELVNHAEPDRDPTARVAILPAGLTQKPLVRASGRDGSGLSTVMAELTARGIIDWDGLGQPCVLDMERLELMARNGRAKANEAYVDTLRRVENLLARGANADVVSISRDVRGEHAGVNKDEAWKTLFKNGLELALLECIALARIGDTDEALRLAKDWDFDADNLALTHRIDRAVVNPSGAHDWQPRTNSKLEQDSSDDEHDALQKRKIKVRTEARAIVGRLRKDQAFRDVAAPEFIQRIREARTAYADASQQSRDTFAEINRLTMSAILGDLQTSEAEALIRKLARTGKSYWSLATAAEAFLLLGRMEEARAALREALGCKDALIGSVSSTRRQLARLATLPSWDRARHLLAEIPVPHVVAFTGHMMIGRLMDTAAQVGAEEELRPKIKRWIEKERPAAAYGALAAGSDILIAEAMLDAGIDLHVILPFRVETFLRVSVDPGDPPGTAGTWAQRFRDCLTQAKSVSFADTRTKIAITQHDCLFREASRLAVGHAMLKADEWSGTMSLLAIWDGGSPTGVAGTAMAVADAQRAGVNLHSLECVWRQGKKSATPTDHAEQIISIVLAADFDGKFDAQSCAIVDCLDATDLKSFAQTLPKGKCTLIQMNDPVRAAELALILSSECRRVACHRGLYLNDRDPNTLRSTIMAMNSFSRASSRPFVTEPFAAILRPLTKSIPLQALGSTAMLKAPGRGAGRSPVLGTRHLFLLG